MDSFDSTLQLITTLFIFVAVLSVTYVVTRWIAKNQKGQMNTGNLEVIETCRLSQTKYIQIIRTGSVYMVIAVCKDTISMLGVLEPEQLDLSRPPMESQSFQEILEKMKTWKTKK